MIKNIIRGYKTWKRNSTGTARADIDNGLIGFLTSIVSIMFLLGLVLGSSGNTVVGFLLIAPGAVTVTLLLVAGTWIVCLRPGVEVIKECYRIGKGDTPNE